MLDGAGAWRSAPKVQSSPTVKDLLLVANPTAQSGKNAERVARAQAFFLEQGVRAELFATLPEGRTITALAAQLQQQPHRVVVAMGGDGTFREVASAILDSGQAESIALGMLPTGTANDQGKSFGLGATEADLPRNVQVIVAGSETRLDAGSFEILDDASRTTERVWFFDSAGFGLSARVLATRNRDRETVAKLGPLKEIYRDHWVYAGALLRTFLESQVVDDKFTAAVDVDGTSHTFHGLTDLVLKGTRIYGGAWVFDNTSRHDDGLFELVTFTGKREWASKAIIDLEGNPLTEELLNAVGIEHSKPLRGKRFELTLAPESSVPIAAQIDGEELACSYHARISVVQRALRLIVPALLALCALGCAHGATVQKLDYDTYRISCAEASLDQCLAEAANNACDRRAYFVARGISDVNPRGRTEAPDFALSSEAVIRCAPGTGWGAQAKELMNGAPLPVAAPSVSTAPSSAPPTAKAPVAVCAPGSTQACVGSGACAGGQACKADGSGYERCDCGPAAPPAAPATPASGPE